MGHPPDLGPITTAPDFASAADAACDHLVARGLVMPSVYFEVGERVRCLAQRGYWQVHDGLRRGVGILGTTLETGTEQLVEDVRKHPRFIAAATEVVAELCIPLKSNGRTVGLLNVESRHVLCDEEIETVRATAAALQAVLDRLGGPQPLTTWQLLAEAASDLVVTLEPAALARRVVDRAPRLVGMSSGVLVHSRRGTHTVGAASGPLAPLLADLGHGALAAIAGWCSNSASVHTVGDFSGQGFAGSERVWAAGVRALVCVPMFDADGFVGFLLTADSASHVATTDEVQCLELFATQVSTAISSAEAYAAMRRQATLDPLTGLGTVGAFHTRLGELAADTGSGAIGIALIDIDNFKQVNDAAGHRAGDAVLRAVARALARTHPVPGLTFRIGGDEFAAIVPDADVPGMIELAGRIRDEVGRGGQTTASIGVAVANRDHAGKIGADGLRADADLALIEAKRGGRDQVAVYHEELRTTFAARARMAAQLSGAIERGELRCVYQPVVNLPDQSLRGFEALLRWTHPELGAVPPIDFIPIAEEDGQIHALGEWVLREAVARSVEWNAEVPVGHVKVGVNVSGAQLVPGFAELVDDILREAGLHPSRLLIEITESALVEHTDRIQVITDLREMGVVIAVDDFGTGYSSLSYLRCLPFDVVKIDRSFVAEMGDPRAAAVLRTILELASTLGLRTVGEGIETAEQARIIAELGCEHGQGYHFARPLEVADARRLLLASQRAIA